MSGSPFPISTHDDWLKSLEAAGQSPEALAAMLREGLIVDPLYSSHSPGPRPVRDGAPELASFVTGARAEMLEQIDSGLAGGVRHFWVGSATAGRDAEVVAELCQRVGDAAGLELVSWIDAEKAAKAVSQNSAVELALDPFQAKGPLALSREAAVLAAYRSSVRSRFVVSTMPLHAAGADAVDEIAMALSTALEFARWSDEEKLGELRLTIRTGVRPDVFLEIAKLRALSRAMAKLSAAIGVAVDLKIHAITSPRVQTLLDPWSNVLRGAAGAFAAITGGAHRVSVLAHDRRYGWTELGERLARNVFHLLMEESHLSAVSDPAGGAHAIESLTDSVARAAWGRMQEIEGVGGMAMAIESGWLTKRLKSRHEGVAKRLSTRRDLRIGINAFAVASEEFNRMGARRNLQDFGFDDGDFDKLRRRSAKLALDGTPAVLGLFVVGDERGAKARLDFIRDVAASAGLTVRPDDATARARCWVGSDEAYGSMAKAPGYTLALRIGGPEDGGYERVVPGDDMVALMSKVLKLYEDAQ